MPVDGQVASICWNEQTKLLTMSLAYSAVYGMGERYNGLNQNDRIVKIEVEEKFCNQGDKSYCPSPFFFTDTGFSFCTLSGGTLIFDFTQKNVITVHVPSNCKFIFNAGTPEKLIFEYMSLSGPAILPPDWVFGPWISANHWNTQKETEKQIELLKKYQFPATVLVLEAWSDEATFYIFNGAKYKEKPNGAPFAVDDFDYSESAYWPNPQEMIKKLHKAGLHLVLWQVPVYKQQSDDEIRNHQNDLDREDAVKRSLCIHNLDGTPYKIPKGHWFPGSMIPDFTNPETCKTWFGKRQYLLDMGVDGFKTDGGEFVCTDAVSFYDGSTGKESRNCYPQQYTKAYTKFLGDNHVLFSRAGYMGQHTTPCHELHIPFNREVNNQLRGVSRMESLKLILRNSPVCYSEQEKFLLAEKKNNTYRELLQNITSKDLADGAWTVLEKLHAVHIPMAIGSSSKNTPLIVEKLGIGKFFDAIVDGNQISHSKPDPEVFLLAAEKLHQKPSDCLVVEDAEAGVKAALNGGFLVAGIGPAKDCSNVNYPLLSLSELLAIEGHPA